MESVHRSPTDNGHFEKTFSFEAIDYAISELNNILKKFV